MLESDNYTMKVLKLFSVLEGQGGQFRLDIAVNATNMRGPCMEESGKNISSQDSVIMGGGKLVGLRYNGRFDTDAIFQGQ